MHNQPGISVGSEAEAEVEWRAGCPVTVNDPEKTKVAVAAACRVAGDDGVNDDWPSTMGSEDFSYMLEKRPGAIISLGQRRFRSTPPSGL
jgi:hippurate hydrolase